MADWMAFNPSDYVANTLHLTTRQHGGYILLICAAWSGKGALPGSDIALSSIAKLSPSEWAEDGDTLKTFLTRRGDIWIHERVEFEVLDAQALIAAKSRAGKEGARKRWHGRANGKAMADPLPAPIHNDAPLPLPKLSKDNLRASRKTKLPEDWKAGEDDLAYAAGQGCADPPDTAQRFCLHHWSKGTLAANWGMAFKYWCRNEKNFRRPNGHAEPKVTMLDGDLEWSARLRGYRSGGMWLPNWGPRPEDGGGHIPKHVLSAWRKTCE